MKTTDKPQTLEELMIEEFRNRFSDQIDPAEFLGGWDIEELEAFIKKVYEAGFNKGWMVGYVDKIDLSK